MVRENIYLIANGQMKIRKLQLQSPNKTLERRYQISIIDERLTQAIFTRGKGGYQPILGMEWFLHQET